MTIYRARMGLILALTVTCSPLHAESDDAGRITNYADREQVEASRAVNCAGITNLTSAYSPEQLYKATRRCVDKREYDHAAQLFSMAGAYGYYDTLRVEYEGAAHAMRYIQILAFQDVGKAKMKRFNAHLSRDYAAGTRGHTEMCRQIQRMGPPSYHPEYMIQHGMRSGLTSFHQAMRADFDSARAWQQTLTIYLRCRIED